MTAVPGQVANMIDLICDRCGDVLSCRADHLRDLDVVWPLLTDQGWAGSPFATGQHSCPNCAGGQLREPSPGATWPVRKHIPRDVTLRQDPHAAIVEVTGDIDRLLVSTIQSALGRAATLHHNIVLDLAAVQLVDPIGLGVLVRGHVRARKRGGHLCLAAPSRFVMTVLHTMRLDDALPVFGDVPSTLTWLAAHPLTPPPAATPTPPSPSPSPSLAVPAPTPTSPSPSAAVPAPTPTSPSLAVPAPAPTSPSAATPTSPSAAVPAPAPTSAGAPTTALASESMPTTGPAPRQRSS